MDHTTLTAEQYGPIVARLTDHRDYLAKLLDRMRANRFPLNDPLFAAVSDAWQAASNACVVACTCRNRLYGPVKVEPPPRAPWLGSRRYDPERGRSYVAHPLPRQPRRAPVLAARRG